MIRNKRFDLRPTSDEMQIGGIREIFICGGRKNGKMFCVVYRMENGPENVSIKWMVGWSF